jgi:MerR family copper efflux transcriptional regulator
MRPMNISEASAASDVSPRMIRHYEKLGLLPAPSRRPAGYRIYTQDDVHRLRFVALARDLGMITGEIQELLSLWTDRIRPIHEIEMLACTRAADLARRREALDRLRSSLLELADRCRAGERPAFPILRRSDSQGSELE